MASKEIYIEKYYLKKNKWIPAIKRFKIVVNEYGSTVYAEEAYIVGWDTLQARSWKRSKKYASVLWIYQSGSGIKKVIRF